MHAEVVHRHPVFSQCKKISDDELTLAKDTYGMFQICRPKTEVWSWSVDDIHLLMSDLTLAEVEVLQFYPRSQLRNSSRTASHTPSSRTTNAVKVKNVNISTTLNIQTLVALLAPLDVEYLTFGGHCNVLEMSGYMASSPQVSRLL